MLGWNHFFEQQRAGYEGHLEPARVYRQDINQYHLWSERGELLGQLTGRFRRDALSKADLPTVGDWVLVQSIKSEDSNKVTIEVLLDRKSRFSRKEAGQVVDEQVVAANIDTVFIVGGLDQNFNPNRIERYLLLSRDSGAVPVIVLNKADICTDLDEKLSSLEVVAMGTPIVVLSALTLDGIEALAEYILPGVTCALMGSSGVGKSTIINALLGKDHFLTGEVRAGDSKGRHTTAFREMVRTPDHALIIDTPGMRELQVWADETSLSRSFTDVEDLAVRCRFSDCRHEREPGCAIQEAINAGVFEAERLQRYRKLARELQHLRERQDASVRAEKKQARKKFARLVRNRPNKRDL